ncbi:MAG: ATP-binding protein [Alphaproteobacteria bacterium]|nr:ATP-binding protein [Alphaproteobacteria bacterium]
MSVPALRGDRVSSPRLAQFAQAWGIPFDSAEHPDASVLALGEVDSERLALALAPPVVACVEAGGGTDWAGPSFAPTVEQAGLYLCLTAGSAHGAEPALAVCTALSARLDLDEAVRQSIELALHEALANAIIHGSLGVAAPPEATVDQFMAFIDDVERRLADPEYAGRRVEIFATWDDAILRIGVRDQGEGYRTQCNENASADRKSGRGLLLIQELATAVQIGEGGRRLTMEFRR